MFSVDEIIDHTGLQRPRAEQSHESHNILEAVWKQAFDRSFMPRIRAEIRRWFPPASKKAKDPIVIENVVGIQSSSSPRRAAR